MKKIPSAPVNPKSPFYPESDETKTAVNTDASNSDNRTDSNETIVDKPVCVKDRYNALNTLRQEEPSLSMEAPFDEQHEKLARPFKYLKKVRATDPESCMARVNGLINQNIDNNVLAESLAQETQFMILQHVRMRDLRVPIRDNIVVSATNHMTSIYLNIINLFTENAGDHIDRDIEELFTMIIEITYRIQDTMIYNSFDKINLEDVRRVIRGLRCYVIRLR